MLFTAGTHDCGCKACADVAVLQCIAMELQLINAVENAVKEMGYIALSDKQKEAIFGFLPGRDVFVSSDWERKEPVL